jgi:hypothetical protein
MRGMNSSVLKAGEFVKKSDPNKKNNGRRPKSRAREEFLSPLSDFFSELSRLSYPRISSA